MSDLLARLRQVDPPGGGEHGTRWYRNPEGPGAADRIEALEAEVERLTKRIPDPDDLRIVLDLADCEYANVEEFGSEEEKRLYGEPIARLRAILEEA